MGIVSMRRTCPCQADSGVCVGDSPLSATCLLESKFEVVVRNVATKHLPRAKLDADLVVSGLYARGTSHHPLQALLKSKEEHDTRHVRCVILPVSVLFCSLAHLHTIECVLTTGKTKMGSPESTHLFSSSMPSLPSPTPIFIQMPSKPSSASKPCPCSTPSAFPPQSHRTTSFSPATCFFPYLRPHPVI